MLALDYLWRQPGIDTTRVEAIGVSLGAPFMSIAGALDTRFSRVWVLHGSGGSYVPLEANMKRNIPIKPVRALAAGIANVIINGPSLDPVQWVPQIAPRPFMMVNASDDERLPRPAVDALYASASEPKEIVWMSGRHIHSDKRNDPEARRHRHGADERKTDNAKLVSWVAGLGVWRVDQRPARATSDQLVVRSSRLPDCPNGQRQ